MLLRQTYNEMALIIAPDILTSFVENEYFTKAYTRRACSLTATAKRTQR